MGPKISLLALKEQALSRYTILVRHAVQSNQSRCVAVSGARSGRTRHMDNDADLFFFGS